MTLYFSAKRIAELNAGRREIKRQFRELQNRLHSKTYKTNRGAEFAKHGLSRRLDILVRAIDQVYELVPPEQGEIPPRDNVAKATMAIQAFVMNAFGCLDNIAWVLVHEKNIKGKGGAELDPKEVGLGKKHVQKKLSEEFLTLLKKHQDCSLALSVFATHSPTAYRYTFHLIRSRGKTWKNTVNFNKRNGRSPLRAIPKSMKN
jgi:hypothetical protein